MAFKYIFLVPISTLQTCIPNSFLVCLKVYLKPDSWYPILSRNPCNSVFIYAVKGNPICSSLISHSYTRHQADHNLKICPVSYHLLTPCLDYHIPSHPHFLSKSVLLKLVSLYNWGCAAHVWAGTWESAFLRSQVMSTILLGQRPHSA